MDIQRLQKLAGIVTEGKEESLWVLYVDENKSGTYHPQFSGTRMECMDEWRDTKNSYKKGAKHIIRKLKDDDDGNKAITENTEEDEITLLEKEMTPDQKKKREQIVLSMKDKENEFKEKYGDKWKSVMYATATKMALKEGDEERKEVLKNHIHQVEEQNKRLAKDSTSYKDNIAQIERWKKELSQLEEAAQFDATPANMFMDSEFEDDKDERNGSNKERSEDVKLPKEIVEQVNKRISEIKKSMELYDEKGYNDISLKKQAIECMEKIMDHLKEENIESFKQAQIYFQTLMSPLTDLFPAKLVNFLANPDF